MSSRDSPRKCIVFVACFSCLDSIWAVYFVTYFIIFSLREVPFSFYTPPLPFPKSVLVGILFQNIAVQAFAFWLNFFELISYKTYKKLQYVTHHKIQMTLTICFQAVKLKNFLFHTSHWCIWFGWGFLLIFEDLFLHISFIGLYYI